MVPNLVLAIIVLLIFYLLGKLIKRIFYKIAHRSSGKHAISGYLATLLNLLCIFLGIFIALNILKLESAVTSILAGASIIGLALGFAFQDLTANFISGAYIAFRKPFEVEDLIETNGFIGTVEDINLRSTTIRTFAGLSVLLPNKEIFQKPIINYSRTSERKIEVLFLIPQKVNLAEAKERVVNALQALKYLNKERQVEFYYSGIDGANVKAEISVWIYNHQAPGYQTARHEVLEVIIDQFKQLGIIQ
jgi:small conductance mechanosensitive channel